MNIAIIGSGFFGVSLSIILAKKHKIDLYEKESDILQGASRVNQFRFHQGYHYPRSNKTINEIKKYKNSFQKFFGNNIFGKTENFYSISKYRSKTSFSNYLKFLKKNKLFFKVYKNKNFFSRNIEGTIIVNEKILNYFKIKKKLKKTLKKNSVHLNFKKEFKKENFSKYDKVIIATYQNNNYVLKKLGITVKNKFRYELVEKILLKLPKRFKNKSFVVLDGNFVCLDPYIGTNKHLLSDVKFSKIEIVKSIMPVFKHKNKKFLNKGLIVNKKISNFDNFVKHGSLFLPFLKKAKYAGSYFVVRTLKHNVEKTDERVSIVKKVNKKVIVILSGKWNTCIGIAKYIENNL